MNQPININKIKEELELANNRVNELSFQLGEYYRPIITDLLNKKDKKGLERLLNEVPDGLTKMEVYEALYKIKNK